MKLPPKPQEKVLTREGYERFKKELDELVRVRRPQVIERLRAARELGDLRENAEYHAAKEEQGFVENRIAELERLLRGVRIIE
ncbi:MAG: Transcription elongation factor GreA [Candidatus Bipolaricaulis sibiricus]|uniref:Transcription elongation factor GreA n=1 Tax=Bipolaricaulis sibiricus TaxID=2501609 RepID=A0A410FSJ0_BIPS1|nr:MAG: Transcription elongation factor GreA [Candidatus Bipolaricaulis sibiricus]